VSLKSAPITLQDARIFVAKKHSHLAARVGGLFAVAVQGDAGVCCVAIVGRPVARMMQEQGACEVTRLCSDGTPHAASKALGAAARAAAALGWRRIVSSTLLGEPGTCYRAAGWHPVALGSASGSAGWDSREGRAGSHVQPGRKVRWETGPDALPLDPEVDRLVRESVGLVEFAERRETLPLLRGLS